MKRFPFSRTFIAALLLCSVPVFCLLSGCSMAGLSPAGSGTSLTLAVSAPRLVSSDSRAAFSDGMVVYLRTVGGPSSGSGPLYGPYALGGTKLTITDIPAGSYDNMAIIGFASAPAQTLIDMVTAATDAEIVADDKSGTSLANFDTLCDGTAVVGMTGGLTLRAGSNSVAATLTPLCSSASRITLSMVSAPPLVGSIPTIVIPASGLLRRFYCIDLSNRNSSWLFMNFTVACSPSAPELALFDSSGKQLSGFTGSGMVYKIPKFSAQDCLYLYVKAATSGSISFTAEEAVPTLSLSRTTVYGSDTAGTVSSGATVNFGSLYSTGTNSIIFTITNTGGIPLIIPAAPAFSSTYGSSWSVTFPGPPVSLPVNGTMTFQMDYIYVSGIYTNTPGVLTISSNDPAGPFTLNVTGYSS